MRFIRSNSSNSSDTVKSFAIAKHTRETVNGICRHNNHPTILKDFDHFPNFSGVRVVGVN